MTDIRQALPGVRVSMKELVRLRAAARGLAPASHSMAFSPGVGAHRSTYRGRGLEFDEVRIYQPGDDVRSIDWRVTARRGKPHTKIFREERERPVLLLVDMHPGMFFGTRMQFKSVLAARATAILSWAAIMAGDRVGGVVTDGKTREMIPARLRRAGVLAMLHAVNRLQPSGPGELVTGRMDTSLALLRDMAGSGAMIIVLSDFRELGRAGERHIRSMAMRNDVLAGFIHDSFERKPPPPGRYRFGTPDRKVLVDTSGSEVPHVWASEFMKHRDRLRKLAPGLAIRWVDFPTDVEASHSVATFTAWRRAS